MNAKIENLLMFVSKLQCIYIYNGARFMFIFIYILSYISKKQRNESPIVIFRGGSLLICPTKIMIKSTKN